MTNREKYAEEILNIACKGSNFAVNKKGEIVRCSGMKCGECIFNTRMGKCEEKLKDWANAEYVENPKISKRDRGFLEYITDCFKYMARDKSGKIFAYLNVPETKTADIWYSSEIIQEIAFFNVDFPMVKWEDEKPWLIENLKKLEVVESYENN